MKKCHLIFIVIFTILHFCALISHAQVGNDSSAIFHIESTDKGILIPRMTASQRDSIADPAEGLMVYVMDEHTFYYHNGTVWTAITMLGDDLGSHIATQHLNLSNNNITNADTVTATTFAGDGSALTNVPGDGLGDHTATQDVNLNNNNMINADTVTATAFAGDGSALTNVPGDDLGNHTATQNLDLSNNNITNADTVTATAFVGDGSGLTNVPGDDLGGHIATQDLDLANNNMINADTVTATAFAGDGSALTNVPGDGLGDHTATQDVNLNNNNITNADTVTATAFAGDGSALTNVPGDDMGSHTATQDLDLNNNNMINADTVTATAFGGDGSALTNVPGDDMGSHTATQNIQLSGNFISGDGENEGLYVDNTGKVGVGTNSPAARLDVTATNNSAIRLHPTGIGPVLTYKAFQGGTKDLQFVFEDKDSVLQEVMRIKGNTNTGYVGIGTSSPEDKLHVKDGWIRISHGSMGPTLSFVDDADNSEWSIRHDRAADQLEFRNNTQERLMVIDDDGKVGIGNLKPGRQTACQRWFDPYISWLNGTDVVFCG